MGSQLFGSIEFFLIIHGKGDIVKQPTKKCSFVPKMYQGWGEVGLVGVGWGGSCGGGVWSCGGGVCHTGWLVWKH